VCLGGSLSLPLFFVSIIIMNFPIRKKQHSGFLIMEALVALSFSLIVMSAAMTVLNRQSKMATDNRNRILLERAIVNDGNAIKHFARHWYWRNSFYNEGNPISNEMIYSPGAECFNYESNVDRSSLFFKTDLSGYTFENIKDNGPIPHNVPGFQIYRKYEYSNSKQPLSDNSVIPGTIRVSYTVKRINSDNSTSNYPMGSTIDIILPALFSC